MIKEILNYIRKNKLQYFLVGLFMLIDYSIYVVPTKIIQFVVDAITNSTLNYHNLFYNLAILFICIVVGYLSGFLWQYKLYAAANNFLYDLRMSMFNKFLEMRQAFYDKFKTGDMLTRFNNDASSYQEMTGYGAMNFLFAFSYSIFVIPAMFAISIKITLMASIPIILCGLFINIIIYKYDDIVEKEREAISNLNNEVLEMVEGVRVTRAYNNASTAFNLFKEKTNALRNINNKRALYMAVFTKIPGIFSGMSTAIIIFFGAYSLFNNEISLGQLVALEIYGLMFLWPMWMLVDFFAVYKSAKVSHQRIKELLKTDDDLKDNGVLQIKEINKIQFKNYSFNYAKGLPDSLDKIDLTINKGETLGIIGKTGSGKTSLIRQLLVQYPLGRGALLINDIPLEEYNRESVERLISYVPQDHFLFSRDVLSNIKIGKVDATMEEVNEAIALAAFNDDIANLSDGLNTLVGEKGVSISGGQKQRILIARALLKNSDLLILDDALSAVDSKTERKIIKSIENIRKNKTNIIVTHRLSAVKNADKVIVMDNGKISEYGTPDELYALKGWYYEQIIRQDLEQGGDE